MKNYKIINLPNEPQIELIEETFWYSSIIRTMCINNALYTKGTNEEYEKILEFVDSNDPTIENMYIVARDIKNHSTNDNDVTHIMFLIKNRVLLTFYDLIEKNI